MSIVLVILFLNSLSDGIVEPSLIYDAAEIAQLDFQDAASPIMEEITFFHNQVMFIVIIILVIVL